MIIKDCEITKNELDRAINKVLFGAHGNWNGWKQLILLSQCGKMELKVASMDYWQGDYDKVCNLTLDMDPERSYISGCLFFLSCPKSTTYPGISYKISEKLQTNYKTFLKFL